MKVKTIAWAVFVSMSLLGAGCKSPRSAKDIAASGGVAKTGHKVNEGGNLTQEAAPATTVIGRVEMASGASSLGVITLQDKPVEPGTFLVARNHDMSPVAILQATETSRGNTQGVTLVNGVPAKGDLVVLPGPDDMNIIRANLDFNRLHAAGAAFEAAGSAVPLVAPGQ